jgi:hypothetical protein
LIIAGLPSSIAWIRRFSQKHIKLNSIPLKRQTLNRIRTPILTITLVACVLFTPLFALPNVAFTQAGYFQVMNSSEYEAIEWVKANTPVSSVFVADASFGWWLSGFAQRPTLSAVSPQYLLLKREVAPAQAASNLLSAHYLIDNGLIQIKQDGAYANGSTHTILGIFNDAPIHPQIFSINDTQINFLYREKGFPIQSSLAMLNETRTTIQANTDQASFTVSHENSLIKVIEEIKISKGLRFAQISFTFNNKTNGVNFDWLHIRLQPSWIFLSTGNSLNNQAQ